MTEITINEAKKRLMSNRPGMYSEFVAYLHNDDVISKSCAYEICGAIAINTFYAFESLRWYVFDIGNSDTFSAIKELREKFGSETEIAMTVLGNYPNDYTLCFSCKGTPYEDSDIRPLTEDDWEQVSTVTNVPDNDSEFGKVIAQWIREDFPKIMTGNNKHILGIFIDGTHTGIIVFTNINNGEVIVISDVFIPYHHRGHGYAPRLIRAAMAVYPDVWYFYSCGSTNSASAASAKSAGYTFEGTYICSI